MIGDMNEFAADGDVIVSDLASWCLQPSDWLPFPQLSCPVKPSAGEHPKCMTEASAFFQPTQSLSLLPVPVSSDKVSPGQSIEQECNLCMVPIMLCFGQLL